MTQQCVFCERPIADGYCQDERNHNFDSCGNRLHVFAAQPAAQSGAGEEPIPVDGKFGILGDRLVNLVSREPIPQDEPLFLLRARDHHALAAIHAYQGSCESDCNELHMAGIQQVREKFCQFAAEHPERMKQPGVTRHLKLAEPAAEQGAEPPSSSAWLEQHGFILDALPDIYGGKPDDPQPYSIPHVMAVFAEAYAAHVTKGLQAELVLERRRADQNLEAALAWQKRAVDAELQLTQRASAEGAWVSVKDLKAILYGAYACHYQQNTFPGESEPCGQCVHCKADKILDEGWDKAAPPVAPEAQAGARTAQGIESLKQAADRTIKQAFGSGGAQAGEKETRE